MKLKFGDELRNVLLKENLNQAEASEKMGVCRQQLSKYIRGIHIPTIVKVEHMLNAIGYELVIREKEK